MSVCGILSPSTWMLQIIFFRGKRTSFHTSGCLHNAQALGIDNIFHIHENDSSEITGYLLLQATDYLSAAGNKDYFTSLIPMLDWAVRKQLNALHNNMLPFNGDETYIAGGIMPRTVLNHGSFEATMLFITGTERYLRARVSIVGNDTFSYNAAIELQKARQHFDHNFRREQRYITNSRLRTEKLIEPATRHGVCLNCGNFTWLHRIDSGIYVCPACCAQKPTIPEPQEYALKSTLLMAPFIGSDLIAFSGLKKNVTDFVDSFCRTGALPSLPDNSRSLGYDYGLLLYSAAAFHIPADPLLQKMLDLQDECGAWSEYYIDGSPVQTRCRPWESAMNIVGGITYLSAL